MARAANDLSRTVGQLAAAEVAIATGVSLLVAAVLAIAIARRTSRSRWLWFWALVSTGFIASMTIARDGAIPHDIDLGSIIPGGWRNIARSDPTASSQFVLNIVLFIPAGVAWTLLSKRPLLTATALAVLSLVIEILQGLFVLGASDAADLVANSVGGLIGVGLAQAARLVTGGETRSTRRLVIAAAAFAMTAIAVGTAFVVAGAGREQARVEGELRDTFAGTTLDDITPLIESGDPFSAISRHSDGARYDDATVIVRYPATFFGLDRCVVVTWTTESVDFARHSGSTCTTFWG